ncbi:glucan 1,4-alpha-glucosidase [Sphingomonas paucimobilis]|uniref:Glycoside hydrolase family 3 protein n=4 Tax=Sphingomonas TaxID=13687 RepID=A0A411LFA3_SPHPI|nr:glycoside hydrolase family 3 protein [Sphingomonas paucimobilis]RSU63137.1 glycoside hydrolase family 3 protein [Sphingomonas sp. S-NIH.Pt1_0416]GAN13100.1 putative beta-glucosidase [Sphingomonas paucimobilis NBRC 13935]QBE90969.1 glycoside hydrolase family 3 protein [Sphingomonas paucimobilis]SUJ15185.1 Periplasmic beta-glucosidase precursor [Sphingomonas paucimobilis]
MKAWQMSVLALMLSASPQVMAQQGAEPAVRAEQEANALAATLVGKMTTDEKLYQLLNTAPAIPRLGVPAYNWWTESLHGALGPVPTTNFPEPVGLAATFDDALVGRAAQAISREVRGLHALARQTGRLGRIGTGLDSWSPNINIFRDPRWGRGQETYGEDPFLTARMGVAFVRGMQGTDPNRIDVVATPKHYAVHSGPESTRHEANVYVSQHDLVDTYLPAFRAAIVEGGAGSIMCAYNRIDGQPACASDLLLKDYLRGRWGFRGYVVSDCDAVKDIDANHHYAPDPATAVAAAMRAGVDNECNNATLTDTDGLTNPYRDALARGLISVADIDRSLTRLFAARYRTGDLPGVRPLSMQSSSPADIGTPAHQALALETAEKSLVLLKNKGILPLKAQARIAVIGPLGDATRVLRGNYSSSLSGPSFSVMEGLRRAMPEAQVRYVPFTETYTDGDLIPTSALQTPDGRPGLLARYYNVEGRIPEHFAPGALDAWIKAAKFEDRPVVTRVEANAASRSLDLSSVRDVHRAIWTGFLVPPETGRYRLGIAGFNGAMTFEGQPFVDLSKASWNSLPTMRTVTLEKGRRYPISVTTEARILTGINLVWKRVSDDPAAELRTAAKDSDALVAVVGLTSDLEAEEAPISVPGFKGGDKTTLDLPADQQALLEQAKATGKPLIVVLMNGSPVNLAWAKANADAIVEAWYPGQAGGLAVGNVLSGKTNPAGRLPLTFYRSVEDLPAFGDYAMKGRTYRYFTGTPVYPFGYGLSYTSFAYAPVKLTPAVTGVQDGLTVTTEVRNTGRRAGDEVAQLYLNFPKVDGAPRVALRGFQRVHLAPGERRMLRFTLDPRDLSAVDADGHRLVMKGDYRVSVGSGQPDTGVAGRSATFAVATPRPIAD